MNLSDLLKLVIPAIFLVIWAINQLLGKEEVTAPPRGQPIGPRPGGLPPAPRPPSSRESPSASGWPSTTAPNAPAPSTATPRQKPVSFGDPDEIFVIRADREPGNRPGSGAGSARRPPRARPSLKKPAEPPPTRRLAAPLPTSLNAPPIDVKLNVPTPAPTLEPVSTPSVPPIADWLQSPGRLREALILGEILGPPRALRAHRR